MSDALPVVPWSLPDGADLWDMHRDGPASPLAGPERYPGPTTGLALSEGTT